jgi:hypothetical protein
MKDTRSIFKLIKELLEREIIMFNNGEYRIMSAQEADNVQARSKL